LSTKYLYLTPCYVFSPLLDTKNIQLKIIAVYHNV